jgi:RNA methyltransferase, TrmH family
MTGGGRRGRLERITSFSNGRIKSIRALDLRKGRREQGRFLVEGQSIVLTARDAGRAPETLILRAGAADVDPGLASLTNWAMDQGADVLEVPEALLEKIASKDNPQAVLGVYPVAFAEMPALASVEADATWIALEEIRDPGNLGTIIRTAHAAGVQGIILAGTCCDPHQRECVRATMGSLFSVPLVPMTREALLDLMAKWPGDTIATHLKGSVDYRTLKSRRPELILMGREGPGLSDAVAQAARVKTRIPMVKTIDSLNLAIATALIVYHVRRERL